MSNDRGGWRGVPGVNYPELKVIVGRHVVVDFAIDSGI